MKTAAVRNIIHINQLSTMHHHHLHLHLLQYFHHHLLLQVDNQGQCQQQQLLPLHLQLHSQLPFLLPIPLLPINLLHLLVIILDNHLLIFQLNNHDYFHITNPVTVYISILYISQPSFTFDLYHFLRKQKF